MCCGQHESHDGASAADFPKQYSPQSVAQSGAGDSLLPLVQAEFPAVGGKLREEAVKVPHVEVVLLLSGVDHGAVVEKGGKLPVVVRVLEVMKGRERG